MSTLVLAPFMGSERMYKYKGETILSPGGIEIASAVANHCDFIGLPPQDQQECIDAALDARYDGKGRIDSLKVGKALANGIRFQRAHASQFDTDDVISSRRWRLGLAFLIVVAMALLLTSYGVLHQ